jgi:SMP-30/Gluconolactonase/LRE-like region
LAGEKKGRKKGKQFMLLTFSKNYRMFFKSSFLLFCLMLVLGPGGLAQPGIAITIKEKDLFPEGIAYDPVKNKFYISSILKNKIVEVKDGEAKDFIAESAEGFMGGAGLQVDVKRRILWACSGNIKGNKYRTGIFAWDLKTKTLLKKIIFAEDTVATFFNDLTIAPIGDVYITNTAEGAIYKWGNGMEKPEKINLAEKLLYPNGIVLLPDTSLIVATAKGLTAISLNERQSYQLGMPDTSVSRGLDGIVYYKNSIIGVFNGTFSKKEFSIVQYHLSKDKKRIIKTDTLEKGNPYFDVPTTAVLNGKNLYVIANSQLDNLDQEKLAVIKKELLAENFVLKYRLKEKIP